jgi:hypothetical protein
VKRTSMRGSPKESAAELKIRLRRSEMNSARYRFVRGSKGDRSIIMPTHKSNRILRAGRERANLSSRVRVPPRLINTLQVRKQQ